MHAPAARLGLVRVEDEAVGRLPRRLADAPGLPGALLPETGGRTHRPGGGVCRGQVGHLGVHLAPAGRAVVVVAGQRAEVLRLGLHLGAELGLGLHRGGTFWLVRAFVMDYAVCSMTKSATCGNKAEDPARHARWQPAARRLGPRAVQLAAEVPSFP